MSVTKLDNSKPVWEKHRFACQRDLILKKIACALISAINIGGITALLAYVVLYQPISMQMLAFAPFIGGVVGALSYLHLPTCGLTMTNYESFLTPAFLFGRFLTLLCFGPIVLMARKSDWKSYHDPFVATRICHELRSLSLEEGVAEHGPHIDNLKKYGFLSEAAATTFHQIYSNSKSFIQAKNFLIREKISQPSNLQTQLQQASKDWHCWQQSLLLPNIPPPSLPDFSKTSTTILLLIRNYLGISCL